MNENDWALTVGIGHFLEGSGLVELQGAVVDAKRFDRWLGGENGGGVPGDHRALILSQPQSEDDPAPTRDDVAKWFEKLYKIALDNRRAGNGFRIGRRLWLFFSGHGASLIRDRTTDTGVFTADASVTDGLFKHINVQLYADFFRDAAAFDQVILVMDCCRSSLKRITPHPLDWQTQRPNQQATAFYAFAVAAGGAAREVETEDGPAGLFTDTLLKLLDNPAHTAVTARQLGELLDSAFEGNLRPDIYPPRLSRLDFEIVKGEPATTADEEATPRAASSRGLPTKASLDVVADDQLARVRLVTAEGQVRAEAFGGLAVDDLPAGAYKLRASLGSVSRIQDLTMAGADVTVNIPPLAIETGLPPGGADAHVANVAVYQQGLPQHPAVEIFGLEESQLLTVQRDESQSLEAELQLYRAELPAAGGRCVLKFSSGMSVIHAVSIPVAQGWRTEIFIVAAANTLPQVMIRMVPIDSGFAVEVPTDRIRESLRAALLQRTVPNVQVSPQDVAGDPIAVLLAMALDSANQREPSAELIGLATSLLGAQNVESSLLRQPTTVSFPPLLNAIWFDALARNRVVVKEGSPADQMSCQLLATEPWLTWDASEASRSADWLNEVADQIWPGWQSSPETSPTRTLEEIQVSLGMSQDALQRRSYKAPPIKLLEKHESIAFVGATHDQLQSAIAVAFALRKRRKWRRISLWFLNDDHLSRMVSAGRRGASLIRSRDRTEAEFANLLPVVADEFSSQRYDVFKIDDKWHFASFWDWDRPGGFVHISEYSDDKEVRTAPAQNMTWEVGQDPPQAYAAAVAQYQQFADRG